MSLTKPIESRARTRDGTMIAHTTSGIPGGPRIVLVHSLAMDRHFWAPVVERLKDTASLLTYDCRGHGASDKPRGPYTIELFADDLCDLVDALGWTSSIVAGASMGGSVALGFATKYPARTTGLGLFDTTAWYGADAPKNWDERAAKADKEGLAGLVDFQKTRWFGDAFRAQRPDVVEASVATFLRNDVGAYAETCRMLGHFNLLPDLKRITVPTAIAVGEEDYATPPKMARELHTGIANSTLTVIKAGRHLTPLETPDAIATQLNALMQRAGS